MSRHKNHTLILLALLTIPILLFSWWLMTKTFSYDYKNHEILMDSHLWSDFGAHISLIRSFSLGPNWTRIVSGLAPQSPLYPGEPIRYHFGFYAFVGLLENAGVPINWAVNIPSIIGLSLMLFVMLIFSLVVFDSLWVGILAVLFTICNGTLSFIQYVQNNGLALSTFLDIPNIKQFVSFGPWDGGPITAFWTLNIFTNQRHLALSYALILGMLVFVLQNTSKTAKSVWIQGILITVCMSTLLFINQAAVLIALPFLVWIFLIKSIARLPLILAGILTLPSYLLLMHLSHPTMNIVWKPGYVISTPLTISSFFHHWIYNIGLHMVCIPLGVILAPRKVKLLFIVPLVILFIAPNLFQFSPDMINNHKFFNFFLIIGSFFTAYALVRLWHIKSFGGQIIGKFIVIFFLGLLTFSGIIDLFVINNDYTVKLGDIPAGKDAHWFASHSRPDDIILNSIWLYHPASIAGRFIYNGYPYFTWSYGYDKEKREHEAINIYQSTDTFTACQLLTQANIRYVELSDKPEEFLHPNRELWENEFTPVYRNKDSGMTVYDVRKSCNMLLQ